LVFWKELEVLCGVSLCFATVLVKYCLVLLGYLKEVEKGIRRADRLRQSILKQAFSGQLVPQDPSDEPAGVLLERIRARQAVPAKAARKKCTPPASKVHGQGRSPIRHARAGVPGCDP